MFRESVIIISSYVLWKDVQEQRAHTQEEEDWSESQSQTQREVQTCPGPSEGSGKCHRIHFYNSLLFVKCKDTQNGQWLQIICVRFMRCGMRRQDTVENGVVFVLKSRGASNSSHKSTDDTHANLNEILIWTFLQCLYSLWKISTDGFDMFCATAQTANKIKSSTDHSKMLFFLFFSVWYVNFKTVSILKMF